MQNRSSRPGERSRSTTQSGCSTSGTAASGPLLHRARALPPSLTQRQHPKPLRGARCRAGGRFARHRRRHHRRQGDRAGRDRQTSVFIRRNTNARLCGLRYSVAAGADLRSLPLSERRKRLQAILSAKSPIISEPLSVTGRGRELFELMCTTWRGLWRSACATPMTRG
jgi:hypothetical protein